MEERVYATHHAGQEKSAGKAGAGYFDSGPAGTAPQGRFQVGNPAYEKECLRQEPSHAAVGITFCE